MLAGLVKSPSAYAPTVDLARATARRNLVLKVMRDSGVITRDQHAKAVRERVVLEDSLRRGEAYGQYFKEAVRRRAGRAVRPRACLRGRPGGLHDHRSGDAEGRRGRGPALAEGDRGTPGRTAPEGRASRHLAVAGGAGRLGSADRRSAGAGRRTRLRRQSVRSGQAGETAGGLGVQAVRLRRRDRSRLLAGVADHESRRADQDAARRVDSGRRAPRVAGDDDADGAADLEQPRRGAHAG